MNNVNIVTNMKNCKRCGVEFEPKKPKAVFCSAKCRVYFKREQDKLKSQESQNKAIPAPKKEKQQSIPKTEKVAAIEAKINKEEIKRQIAEIKKEVCPSFLSKVKHEQHQNYKISELEKLLNQ